MAETLLAWLQNAGNARLAAGQLHVHPQTVRYRLRQIQDLFGLVLGEPGARFELEVALRARGLLRARPVPRSRPPAAGPPAAGPPRSRPGAVAPAPGRRQPAGHPQGDQGQGGA